MKDKHSSYRRVIERGLSQRSLFAEALFQRPESLSALLPYDSFIEGENIFQLKDGSLGAVFKVELVEHEPMTEKQIRKVVKSNNSWFSLPENCSLQVIYDQSAYSKTDNDFKKIEESYPEAHPVSKLLFSKKIEELKKRCGKEANRGPLLKRQTLISVRYFPQVKTSIKAQDYCKRVESLLHREMQSFVLELERFKLLLRNIESSSEISLKLIEASDLIDYLRRFFNPKTYYKREFAPFNKNISLSEQLIFNSPTLDYEGIEREGVKTRTISLKTSPLYSYDGGMAYFTELKFPYKLSLSFSFPSRAKVKRYFDIKSFFLENSISPKSRIQKEEVEDIQEKLARNDRCLNMTFNIVVEGESDKELENRVSEICSLFHNKLECEVIEEDSIGLGLCLNSLPLNYMPDSDHSTQRAIKIMRSDAVRFLPIFDSFRGLSLREPLSVFESREGNIIPFSLLGNQSNHTVILSDTGSGKSAFVIECLQAAKRIKSPKTPEPIVFILDKKSSYAMLSKYYNGNLTIFDRTKEIPFSPFRGKYDEEKIAFLTHLISMAVKMTSPSFNLESEHKTAISKALKLAYLKKCERQGLSYVDGDFIKQEIDEEVELSMEDFIIELGSLDDRESKNISEIVQPLISKLTPFYGDGIYAKFFSSSQNSSRKNCLFYVYDLDALDSDPILQSLMTMSVIEEIRSILSLPEHQGRTGFLVMEEFAMLGRKNPYFRDFIIDFAETMRKRGCWIIACTPRPQNYFELETGKALWGVASNYIFLQMNPDNLEAIATHSKLFDEANTEIVRSLRTIDGEHADVYYTNKEKTRQGAFRFKQTSYDKWMSPTNALSMKEALKAIEAHENEWDALAYLVKKFPNGIKLKSS